MKQERWELICERVCDKAGAGTTLAKPLDNTSGQYLKGIAAAVALWL